MVPTHVHRHWAGPCLLLALASGAASPASADDLSILARTASPSPYGSSAQYCRFINNGYDLFRPLISNSGHVCFQATMTGSSVPGGTDLAVFCKGSAAAVPIWRLGTQATGLPAGVNFAGVTGVQMSPSGEVAYIASLLGSGVQPGVNSRGAWLGNQDGATWLAREGTAINLQGYSGATLRWLNAARVASPDAYGPAVIAGSVDGTSLGSGLQCVLQQSPFGGFEVAMIANTQLPGAAAGTSILSMTPLVGPTGISAYQTTLTGPAVGTVTVNGIPINTNKAITAGMAPNLRTIARAGSQIPTQAAGVAYWLVWGGSCRMSVNAYGDVAFSASMAGPGIQGGDDWCIWTDRNGQLSRIVRLNESGPLSGTTISSFGLASAASFVSLADNGAVVFTSTLAGSGLTFSNNATIIHAHNGVRTLVARGGVDLPALPAGVRIANNNLGLGARVGSSGHVALAAKLEGTGVTTANDAAVFLWSPDSPQNLRLVCREGQTIGQHRITTLSQTGTDLHVNSAGQIVFTATVVNVNDSTQTPRNALLAASPSQDPWIVAAEGESLALPTGAATVRTLRIGTAGALNDSGRTVFVADFGNGTVPDEAVVVAHLTGGPQQSPPNPCPPDYDRSGSVTIHDVFAFLTDWFAGNADYNNSGATDEADLFAFIVDWFNGCP
ncbi:MAG: hypothetical protein KF699_07100 [Phycisphaeraceae bacterium]|nr:hypothetical protein [Phycisphaeraceae bacterium]